MAYRMPRIKLRLEPRVISALIESSGMDHATIAQKLKVQTPRVDGWADTGVIEYSKVKALAKCIKRSENLFLTTIPHESEELPSYRMLRGAPEKLDADDLPKVRRVRYMQSTAKEMMDDQGIVAKPDIPHGVTVSDSAGMVARVERARLAVAGDPDGPVKGSSSGVYKILRDAVEGRNIFVFQYPLNTEGVCGLSMSSPDPCAILVNSRDTNQAKAFALLHEYGHILLGSGGVCDEHGTGRAVQAGARAEAWCNRFAASFLMPESGFAAELERLGEHASDPFAIVKDLARKFKVSWYAAAVRSTDLASGRSKAAYGGVLDEVAGRYGRRQRPKGGEGAKKGGPRYLDRLVSQIGEKFIRLTVSSHERGDITSRDLGDYFDIDLKHLDGICKRAGATGAAAA